MTRFDPALLPPAPTFSFESEQWAQGLTLVAGVDEAGRGALAGPVAAGAVIFPPDPYLAQALVGVRDSKQMAPAEREHWASRLPALALACGIGFSSNDEIDRLGILPATRLAMQRALDSLAFCPQHLLLDYLRLPESRLPQTPIVKGDARSLSIAAASILAKTARDALLRQLDLEYPAFGFAAHKGYGTPAHLAAIHQFGLCPYHRRSFRRCF
jgi:ribonuclease HII